MDAVDECRRHIEVRLTKPRERRLKIEQSLLMGLGQDAQGTGDEQVPAFGFGVPFPLVDQEAVGIERQRECDRRAFAGIEKLERSEEHTSELQSLRHLVCRLLLEKKNK